VFRPLSVNLGLRYAWSGRSLSSFIGIVALAGLVLSVAVLLLVTSVMNGFERELTDRVLGVMPHVTVRGRAPLDDWQSVARQLDQQPSVLGVAPFIDGPGLVVASKRTVGVVFTGIDPQSNDRVSDAARYMTSGRMDALRPDAWGVVLGAGVAQRLGVHVGDVVTAILPEASISLIGITPRQKRLHVVGILTTESELDARAAYLHIADASRLFHLGKRVHGIEVRIDDVFAADATAERLVDAVGSEQVYSITWMRTHGNLYRAIAFQRAVMFLLLSLLVGVAAFNLVSALVMIVNQRRGDIAVMRTLGSGSGTITTAFLVLGLLIGVGGVAIGVALGVGASLVVQDGYAWVERAFDVSLMTQYFVTYLPSELRLGDVVRVVVVALGLCALSTLYPALRAAALRPAEVLRHE
jgi:lipoprotein-releasing system permease protein